MQNLAYTDKPVNTKSVPLNLEPEKPVQEKTVPLNPKTEPKVEPKPRRSFKNLKQNDVKCSEICAAICITILVILTFPFSLFFCFRTAAEFERVVIFRLGRLRKGEPRGPGVFFVLPCIDDYYKVDMRTLTIDIPLQEILTRDSAAIQIDAIAYYRIINPIDAVVKVANFRDSIVLLAQVTLRNIAGKRNMNELLSEKECMSCTMQTTLDKATEHWGVKVERVEIRDIRLPQSLQKALYAETEAFRESRAKMIAADGEVNAAMSLKRASDIISSSPAALQLRYLQTLAEISSEQKATVIFPFPIELSNMFGSQSASRLGCTCFENG